MTVYYPVYDLKKSLKPLVDAGARTIQELKDVGGGRLTTYSKDENGEIIGVIQDT
jgi:predicted enzyme related to lactoylglutathione lyase